MIELLNQGLIAHLNRVAPECQRIDDAIHWIEATHGTVRIREVADRFGQSPRQFERVFLETVGIPAKTFAKIMRFQFTAHRLVTAGNPILAEIAADLDYVDQSHMNRDFKCLAGITPAQFARKPVAFLQDGYLTENE